MMVDEFVASKVDVCKCFIRAKRRCQNDEHPHRPFLTKHRAGKQFKDLSCRFVPSKSWNMLVVLPTMRKYVFCAVP